METATLLGTISERYQHFTNLTITTTATTTPALLTKLCLLCGEQKVGKIKNWLKRLIGAGQKGMRHFPK